MIRQITLDTITAAGEAGSAVGTVVSKYPIVGRVLGVHFDVGGTLTPTVVAGTPSQTILTPGALTADAWYYPRLGVHSYGGTALTLEGTEPVAEAPAVVGYVEARVADGGTDDTLTVTVVWED